MVEFFLIILAGALAFAIGAWIRGRPKKWLFPSDVFFILCVLTSGFVPFVNLHADSQFAVKTSYSDGSIIKVLFALSVMFGTFGLLWSLRPSLKIPDLVFSGPSFSSKQQRTIERRNTGILRIAGWVFFAFSIGLLFYPPYLTYKLQVIEFLFGQINEDDYQLARRVTFADDNLIIGVIGRLRFSIYPIAFVAIAFLTILRRGLAGGLLVAALAFLAGPASFAKAPIVIFLIYFVIVFLLTRGVRQPFVASTAIVGIAVALTSLLVLLTGIYLLQYGEQFSGADAIPSAFALAYFRVFVATYGGLLQYISTFPNGDVGIAATVVAPIFGESTRALDQEVSIAYLGPVLGTLTTFPTVFIGNAYAMYGFLGVFVFSVAVALIVFWVDHLFTKLRSPSLRILYYAIMLVQVNFFAIISAQTAVITYGVIVIPLLLFGVDRFVARRRLPARRLMATEPDRPHRAATRV